MNKKYIGYTVIAVSAIFTFYRGKRQAYLDCIDFNIMPFITNCTTILVCVSLVIIGIRFIEKGQKNITKTKTTKSKK